MDSPMAIFVSFWFRFLPRLLWPPSFVHAFTGPCRHPFDPGNSSQGLAFYQGFFLSPGTFFWGRRQQFTAPRVAIAHE